MASVVTIQVQISVEQVKITWVLRILVASRQVQHFKCDFIYYITYLLKNLVDIYFIIQVRINFIALKS